MSSAVEPPVEAEEDHGRSLAEWVRWFATYAALSVVVGAVVGVLWRLVVRLPEYRITTTFRAEIGERGVAEFFSSDAWFSGLGLVAGIGLGVVAWRWFRPLGPSMVGIGLAGSVTAALVCWGLSELVRGESMEARVAAAQAGDTVPIDLVLHAPVAVLLWPFGAVLPLLVLATFAPDPEDRPPEPATM